MMMMMMMMMMMKIVVSGCTSRNYLRIKRAGNLL
jgi:hypothetical protein